ncbi:MAG: MFS transporter [Limibacillus sp.]
MSLSQPSSARLSLLFSCLGHSYMHLFAAFYFVIVVTLEEAWVLPYADLLELWTLGALLIGLAALPAGWLADRWSAPGMMTVMFLGMGAASIFCGFSDGTTALWVGLTAIGLFAAIYHPVGIAWVVRSAKERGKALGINGIFGSFGIASSALVAGALIDGFGWRAAFIVPGIVSLLTGFALLYCLASGRVRDEAVDQAPEQPSSRSDRIRAFLLLMLSMFCIGLVFQATQSSLPKLFDLRLGQYLGEGALGVGALVAALYTVGGAMQYFGGRIADRVNVKRLYLTGLLLQVPCYMLVAYSLGLPLVLGALGAIFLNASVLPAENMLLARFTPQKHRSLAYGAKFVLAFSAGPLAVKLVAAVQGNTGEFTWVFLFAIMAMAVAFLASSFIPDRRDRQAAPAAQPAE